MEGKHYTEFICITPVDYGQEAVLSWNPAGQAGRFHGVLGCDYPPVMPKRERNTVAIRRCGKSVEFITLIELFEEEREVADAAYDKEAHTARVRLGDGTVQEICFPAGGDGAVAFQEYDADGEKTESVCAKPISENDRRFSESF